MGFLELKEVVAGYSSEPVLRGISLAVEQEKISCIIGPNGSGKSTLLKTIFGFLRPMQGDIQFFGKSIIRTTPSDLLSRGMAYVPQGRSTFPRMTINENLEMGGYIINHRSELKKQVAKVYDLYPFLFERRNHLAGTLSGGQQRMLELARTVMFNPHLILVDEPSIGLSPKFVNDVYGYIIDMNRRGITILLVEQNVNKALEVSNHVYVLDLGRKHCEGSPSQIRSDPEVVDLYLGGRRIAGLSDSA